MQKDSRRLSFFRLRLALHDLSQSASLCIT